MTRYAEVVEPRSKLDRNLRVALGLAILVGLGSCGVVVADQGVCAFAPCDPGPGPAPPRNQPPLLPSLMLVLTWATAPILLLVIMVRDRRAKERDR